MKNEIKILSNGVSLDTRNVSDVLCFAAERAEWTARTFLENLPTDEPERTQNVLEAHRNFCLLDVVYKDKASRGLLPTHVAKAMGNALDELREGFNDYVKRFPGDKAARMLSSGAAPTLRFYLATALEDYHEQAIELQKLPVKERIWK